jgi:Flp pilus assembly protein TadB
MTFDGSPTEVPSGADRRRFVSPWFKRRVTTRLIFAGLVVAVAAGFALGPVGAALGLVVVAGGTVLVHFVRRRKRWREVSRNFPSS